MSKSSVLDHMVTPTTSPNFNLGNQEQNTLNKESVEQETQPQKRCFLCGAGALNNSFSIFIENGYQLISQSIYYCYLL